MQRRALMMAAALIGFSWLGAKPASADFCVRLNDGFPGNPYAFFRFKGGYTTTPEKKKALLGKVSLLDMGNVTEVSPAFGATLGLPVGDAGVKFGVQFSANGLSTFAAIVLDDNGMTTGGGTVTLTGLGSFDGEAAIVDCATEPVP